MIIPDMHVLNAAVKMATVPSTMKHSRYALKTHLWTSVSIAITSVIWEGKEFNENNKRRYKQHEQDKNISIHRSLSEDAPLGRDGKR